jgi:hypothetical protein
MTTLCQDLQHIMLPFRLHRLFIYFACLFTVTTINTFIQVQSLPGKQIVVTRPDPHANGNCGAGP